MQTSLPHPIRAHERRLVVVLAAVAVFGGRRPAGESQLLAAANNFRWALLSARQRAIASHNAYFVQISPTEGFRFCQATSPASPTLGTACLAGEEVSPWVQLGDQVSLAGFARATHVKDSTGTAFSGTERLLVTPAGEMDGDPGTNDREGFTLYLQTAQGSRRKVYVWPLSCQNRTVDRW